VPDGAPLTPPLLRDADPLVPVAAVPHGLPLRRLVWLVWLGWPGRGLAVEGLVPIGGAVFGTLLSLCGTVTRSVPVGFTPLGGALAPEPPRAPGPAPPAEPVPPNDPYPVHALLQVRP
jgi:hypothetical protein